jgi:DNA helicase IV
MPDDISLKEEQDYIDLAYSAREFRRSDRKSGKANISTALTQPVNTLAGGKLENLRLLGDVNEDVCFANFTKEDKSKIYLGKYLVTDANYDALVISWKAPAASDFYRANHANAFGLLGKRRFIFNSPNKLRDLEEVIFKDLEANIKNLTRSNEADVSDAVLDELEKGSSGSLKEIIKTIHASQYDIISSKRGGLHVIQGAPGTGKTVVGVHRASWLLFPGNDEQLKADKVLILGPNAAFIRYIENLVPSLGEDKISHKDLSKLGPNISITVNESFEVAKLKGSSRMKKLLIKAVKDRLRIPEEDVNFTVPGKNQNINISFESISQRINELRTEKHNYMSGRSAFRIWLLNEINDILQGGKGIRKLVSRNSVFIKESDVDSLTEKIWPSISAVNLIRDLYGSQARLLSAAKDSDFLVNELVMLEKKSNNQNDGWSISDIALIDYVDTLLNGQKEIYDYIIVDEAQDLTPMQIESIKKRSSNGDILLMGDLAQATGVWLYSSWQQLADLLGEPISRFDELEFGYRVPKQIFEYATKVLSYIDPKIKPPRLVREVSESPVVNINLENLTMYNLVTDIINDKFGEGIVGLIVSDDMLADVCEDLKLFGMSFTELNSAGLVEGLNVVPVSRQKGLEFDTVVIYEPKAILDIPLTGLRHLYVAITRSLNSLHFYCAEELPIELIETCQNWQPILNDFDQISDEIKDFVQSDDLILQDLIGYANVKGITLEHLLSVIRHGIHLD